MHALDRERAAASLPACLSSNAGRDALLDMGALKRDTLGW